MYFLDHQCRSQKLMNRDESWPRPERLLRSVTQNKNLQTKNQRKINIHVKNTHRRQRLLVNIISSQIYPCGYTVNVFWYLLIGDTDRCDISISIKLSKIIVEVNSMCGKTILLRFLWETNTNKLQGAENNFLLTALVLRPPHTTQFLVQALCFSLRFLSHRNRR